MNSSIKRARRAARSPAECESRLALSQSNKHAALSCPALAAELVQLKPDVIVAGGSEPVIRALQQAAGTIPIVMMAVDYDPIARGYALDWRGREGTSRGYFSSRLSALRSVLEAQKNKADAPRDRPDRSLALLPSERRANQESLRRLGPRMPDSRRGRPRPA